MKDLPNNNEKLKGVWLDGGLWETKELTLIQKHFLQKIKDLDNEKGCIALNGFFAEFFDLSKPRCSQIISSLKAKNLISVELKYEGKRIVGRVLRILKGGIKYFKGGIKYINRPLKNIKGGYLENAKDNNRLINNRVNNLVESIKEKNTRLKEIESENENLKAQILELKILNEKQRKKVSLKKESASTPLGLSSFAEMEYRRKNKTWTQLDTNFNGGFKMPKEWPENLQNEVLGQWIYLDEKKGQNWGTNRTLSAQINLINDWLKKYNPAEIIESLKDCQQRGNVTPNPKWTINRKLKEKQDDEKQRANNGKSLYENYADYLRGDGDTDEDDTIDISWASA